MQNGTVTLVMDTSASPLLIAAEKDGRTVCAHRKGIKQEKLLFPVLERVLGKLGAQLKDISRICIVRGPGRFTGIRISLTFASLLKELNRTRVYGVTVFEALYRQNKNSRAFLKWQQKHPTGVMAVILHAFREEYFLQIFDAENSAPRWLSRAELQTILAGCKKPLFIAGTDKNFMPLTELAGAYGTLAPFTSCRVSARQLLACCGDETCAQQALEPLYLKPARFELVKPV
jgi:tRNA threonylcarbamoyl adenosine modification protein YeaZ